MISIKMVWIQLLIIQVNIFLMHGFIHTDIVRAFFKEHSLSHGNILTCYNKKGQIGIMKSLNRNKDLMILSSNMYNSNLLDLLFTQYKRIGVVLDGDCLESNKIIMKAGRYRFFDIKYYWLILTSRKEYKHIFYKANINIDSNIWVVTPDIKSPIRHYDVDDFYNPASSRGGNFIIKELGYYNNLTGYNIENSDDKFWQRKNLSGVMFNTMIVFHDPYTEPLDEYLKSNENREKNTYNRFHARLMHYCGEHYDFGINKKVTNLFGYQKLDGTMDGLVGELERHNVDFGLSPLFIRRDRANVITYGRLTYILQSAFFFRNPKSRNTFELFIRPLSLNVWYVISGLFIFSMVVLKWSLACKMEKRNGFTDPSWSFSIVSLIGAFCQQGTTATPTLLCGKIGVFFILLLTTITYQFYSGSLVSSLLNIPLILFNSVDDLLGSNFKIGVEDLRLNKEYFKYTNDNSSLKLFKKWIVGKEREGYFKAARGLQLMKKGQFAFHVELAKAYPYIKLNCKDYEVCEITQLQMYKPIGCYANYVKHSPFRDIMDVCLQRIAESGVLQKEMHFWHAKKPECVYGYNISTGIGEFYPVLICLGTGIVLSITILLLEILFSIYKKYCSR